MQQTPDGSQDLPPSLWHACCALLAPLGPPHPINMVKTCNGSSWCSVGLSRLHYDQVQEN